MTPQMTAWLEDIGSGDPRRMGLAGACLAECEPVEAVVPPLVASADAGGPAQRAAALQVVGAWRRTECLGDVRRLAAAHPDEAAPVLCRGRLGDAEALPAVAGLVDHEDPFVQGEALWILGEAGDSAHAAAVMALLDPVAGGLATGEAIVAAGKLRLAASRPRLVSLLHTEVAAGESYVWIDQRGSRNEARATWRLIDVALRSIDGEAAASDDLEAARQRWAADRPDAAR